MRRVVAALLVVLLGTPASGAWAQQLSPALLQAAQEACRQQQQEEPKILPLAKVDPKLVGKKVVVHCRDGRIYKGKLLDLERDSLRLRVGKRTQQLSLSEVATVVEAQPCYRGVLKIAIIAGAIVAALAILAAEVD